MVHPSDDVNSVAHSLTSRRGKEIAVMTFLNGDSRLFALSLSLSLSCLILSFAPIRLGCRYFQYVCGFLSIFFLYIRTDHKQTLPS